MALDRRDNGGDATGPHAAGTQAAGTRATPPTTSLTRQ
jgi:hypothetical protein